jgi:glycosyltransferase involved in cell wall biosynthesis
MDRSRVALVIPAYNEEKTIANVVIATVQYGQPIVVNDCSSDATSKIASDAGAVVVDHVVNRGYDGALNSGFAEAIKRGYEVIITLDADGQHDPDLIRLFLSEIESGADVVLGVRDKRPRFSEHLFAFYTNLRYGVLDPLCGMKAYKSVVYDRQGFFDSYNSIGTQLALYAVRNRYAMKQVKFVVRDRLDQPRFAKLFNANMKILRAMLIDIFT